VNARQTSSIFVSTERLVARHGGQRSGTRWVRDRQQASRRSAPTLYGKEHRKVDHINASEEARGVDADEAKNIAYATVNKQAQR